MDKRTSSQRYADPFGDKIGSEHLLDHRSEYNLKSTRITVPQTARNATSECLASHILILPQLADISDAIARVI
jgi:hypothetical protein